MLASNLSLENRMQIVMDEFCGAPSKKTLGQIPYCRDLVEQVEKKYGSLDKFYASTGVEARDVPFPSQHQLHTMATAIEKKRMIIGDKPGTRKTASASLAKYAIEQTTGVKNLKTLVICPTHLIPHWTAELEKYTTNHPRIVPITKDNRSSALKLASDPNTDYVIVGYDLAMRPIEKPSEMDVSQSIASYSSQSKEALLRVLESHGVSPERFAEKDVADLAKAAAYLDAKNDAKKIGEALHKIFKKNGPYMVILDEFPKIRNPEAKKEKIIRDLASGAEFLLMLSGTKTPNGLDDIANPASILNPEKWPTAESFAKEFGTNPALIRQFYHLYEKKPELKLEDLTGSAPELRTDLRDFDLSGIEKEAYSAILNFKDIRPSEKLLLLRYATMDASLLHPEKYPGSQSMKDKLRTIFSDKQTLLEEIKNITPTKYLELEKILADVTSKGEKFLIYTKYAEGITEKLASWLQSKGYRFDTITKDVSITSKEIKLSSEEIRKLEESGLYRDQKCRLDLTHEERSALGLLDEPIVGFSDRHVKVLECQVNPDAQGILATEGTLDEGENLNKVNHVVFLDLDYIPGVIEQCVGRAWRSGQTNEVHQHYVRARGTIDVGVYEHIMQKKGIIEKADLGITLTNIEASMFRERTPIFRVPTIARHLLSAGQYIVFMSGQLIGKGVNFLKKFLSTGDNAAMYADRYNYDWEYSYSAHTARLLEQIIDKIGCRNDKTADLGCGPAALARQMKKPMICVDLNQHQLKIGKQVCKDLGFEVESHVESIHSMPFIEPNSLGLSVCSLALHYGTNEEREATVREINRITDVGKYAIFTLPKNVVNDEGKAKLLNGLESVGFEVDTTLTGVYEGVMDNTKKHRYEAYVVVAQKSRDSTLEDLCGEDAFVLNTDLKYTKARHKGNKKAACGEEPEERVLISSFRNVDTGVELDTSEPQMYEAPAEVPVDPIPPPKAPEPPTPPVNRVGEFMAQFKGIISGKSPEGAKGLAERLLAIVREKKNGKK